MELLNGNIKKLYSKYLFTALGSTIISSIYSSVDMIAVGHYCGPNGSAAISCINPLWSIMISAGLLFGVGGAVHMSNKRGAGDKKEGDSFFTLSLLLSTSISVIISILYIVAKEPLLRFFGADDTLLTYAADYSKWIAYAVPAFTLGTCLSSFIRNDGAPGLCTGAILTGGVINVIGDFLFVFGFDMGASGAGLATALGQTVGFLILCSYFFNKKCTLKLTKISFFGKKLFDVITSGFAPCIVDLSFGVTVILFNNQIMKYAGSTELAVFGTVSTIAMLFQCLFYGVGQALQPIVSVNFGAARYDRVSKTLKMSAITSLIMGLSFLALSELIPSALLRLYMKVTPSVMAIGPKVFRIYALSFIFMGVNIIATYFLQSVLKSGSSVIISLSRGIVICGILVMLLPVVFGFDAIWYTMPLTELLTSLFSIGAIIKSQKKHI